MIVSKMKFFVEDKVDVRKGTDVSNGKILMAAVKFAEVALSVFQMNRIGLGRYELAFYKFGNVFNRKIECIPFSTNWLKSQW